MKSFVIIGLGRFGDALARELFRLGNEVLAVDKDEEPVAQIADCVTYAMSADAGDEQVLRSIGARNYDTAVVAFSEDIQDNILITLMLKELGVKEVIVKAKNELHSKVLRKIGADRIVFPESEMGMRLAQMMTSSSLIDYIDVSDEYSIVEIGAPHKWKGQSIRDLDVRARHGINILVVKGADGRTVKVAPTPDYIIQNGDALVVIGTNDDIGKLAGTAK